MREFLTIVALVLWLTPGVGGAFADEKCPKGNAPIFEEDLQAIPDCAAAHALHDACSWGSSGDAGLAGVVIQKCEALFLKRLSRAQKQNYDARVQRCADKYAREEGSIAVAEAAMCEEEIAVSFAKNADAAGAVKAAPLAPVKASFDCRKAQTRIEQLICGSDALGDQDIDLSKAYQKALKGAAPEARKTLMASENGWIAYVAKSCASPDTGDQLARLCAQSAYDARIAQLPLCMAKAGLDQAACLNDYGHAAGGVAK
jgi:uncharacterized protein YecT (DUF1311 family)